MNRVCLWCGKPLTGKQVYYCSHVCNTKYLWHKKKKKMYCLMCGKELGIHRRIYCSDECMKMAMKLKEKEHQRAMKQEDIEAEEWLEQRTEALKKRRIVTMPFEEVVAKANELGISYGEYVARYDHDKVC